MRYHPPNYVYRPFEVDEHEPGPQPRDPSAGLTFVPVQGSPGIWQAPDPGVRRAAVQGFLDERPLYQAIVKANPELFRHGPPHTVKFYNGYRNRIVKDLVRRAPYQPVPFTESPEYENAWSYAREEAHRNAASGSQSFADYFQSVKRKFRADHRERLIHEAQVAQLHE